ncbi:MAG: sterol desaturase family protein [Myxococcales bacterium]|nr:sterol desaturase family protein [Myxococcales bacterium]
MRDTLRDYVRHQRGRMYQNDFIEFFSKVHPSMPFLFWIPMTSWVLGSALLNGTTTWQIAAAAVPLGFLTWQFMEYFIHKHVFHTWPGWTGHGFHHKYPDDDTRLVMPLPVSIVLASLIWGGLSLIGRADLTLPFWAGIVIGYLWYDFLHWSTHHRAPWTEWGKRLRAHHMAHHFADPDRNYGISHMWMDSLIGTMLKRASDEKNEANG